MIGTCICIFMHKYHIDCRGFGLGLEEEEGKKGMRCKGGKERMGGPEEGGRLMMTVIERACADG